MTTFVLVPDCLFHHCYLPTMYRLCQITARLPLRSAMCSLYHCWTPYPQRHMNSWQNSWTPWRLILVSWAGLHYHRLVLFLFQLHLKSRPQALCLRNQSPYRNLLSVVHDDDCFCVSVCKTESDRIAANNAVIRGVYAFFAISVLTTHVLLYFLFACLLFFNTIEFVFCLCPQSVPVRTPGFRACYIATTNSCTSINDFTTYTIIHWINWKERKR